MSNIIRCDACGFELWRPIASLNSSDLGLYSDARFPGRSILSLNEHFDHLDELPPDTLYGFMMDVRNASAAIKTAMNAERVNAAILGNQEGHVHAHLIPRQPSREPRPNKAPWEDTRDKQPLGVVEESQVIREIQDALDSIYPGSTRYPIPRTADYIRRRNERQEMRTASAELPLFDLISDSSDKSSWKLLLD